VAAKCPNCQSDNPDNAKFCSECAAPLQPVQERVVTKTIEIPMETFTRGTIFAERYEIIEELGKGGMGHVFHVTDKETNEEIALKLIKPEIALDKKTIGRFRNELILARKIRHKNICGMYDLSEYEGTYYITMEYIPGEDLQSLVKRVGRLDTGTAIKIAKQVCEGLGEAHRLGVVHRDLKPSNIMIDREGNARIMDFGIARSLSTKSMTGEGMIIGTPEYMSPEQAEAKEVDPRSDIYSLGIILYEMLTGQLPFDGDTPLSIAMKHQREKPKDPRVMNSQIPKELCWIILKCLEKNKGDRYETSAKILSELDKIEQDQSKTGGRKSAFYASKRLLIPALITLALIGAILIALQILPQRLSRILPENITSIAVLPFEDLSPQKDQEYFCDGMTDEIIAKLSTLEGLKVISRTSVMQYKYTDTDAKQIGQDLGVKTILEGSVRKEENDIRITIQLVNAEDRFQIWADSYDQKLERIFEIQSDIAENIAASLRTELSPEIKERIKKRPTENLGAYKLLLQGRYFWNQRTVEGFRKAIRYFEDAIDEDPTFALAYVGLAESYNLLGGYEFQRPREVYPKAREAAMKALEIDEDIAEAHTALAWNKFRFEMDWDGANAEFLKGIELNPNSASTHSWYSMFLVHVGRFDEAIGAGERALELDPLSLPGKTQLGFTLFVAGRYDEAIETLESVLEMNPNFAWANSVLGEVYERNGKYTEAIAYYRKAIEYYGDSPTLFIGFLGHAYGKNGQIEEAKKILNDLKNLSQQQYVSPFAMAIVYLGMGQKDQAFTLFEKAFDERSTQMSFLKFEFRFDPVRSDPRFIALLKKAGLG
jgi:serine/threonine protein kinase/Tfp pilus assembly protein PilF